MSVLSSGIRGIVYWAIKRGLKTLAARRLIFRTFNDWVATDRVTGSKTFWSKVKSLDPVQLFNFLRRPWMKI